MENNSIRDKIITESIGLFMDFGIRSVTMDDIAKHLGMSKNTIYQHLKDEEEIMIMSTAA
jgi:AcrR family transcriptional regulator